MIAVAKPIATVFHLPSWVFPRLIGREHQRRQTTIDLIHSSPHLLRDIGATADHFNERYR